MIPDDKIHGNIITVMWITVHEISVHVKSFFHPFIINLFLCFIFKVDFFLKTYIRLLLFMWSFHLPFNWIVYIIYIKYDFYKWMPNLLSWYLFFHLSVFFVLFFSLFALALDFYFYICFKIYTILFCCIFIFYNLYV